MNERASGISVRLAAGRRAQAKPEHDAAEADQNLSPGLLEQAPPLLSRHKQAHLQAAAIIYHARGGRARAHLTGRPVGGQPAGGRMQVAVVFDVVVAAAAAHHHPFG